MTSREVIRRCVHFGRPPRVGMYRSKFAANDLTVVYDFFQKDADGFDPWGIQWSNAADENVVTIGIPKTPPLKDETEIGRVKTPDPKLHARRTMDNLLGLPAAEKDKYRIIATSSGIWERIQYFRGMEDIMVDMTGNPGFVHRLVGVCADFWIAYIGELAAVKGEVDAIYMFDDWGTQQDILISSEMWRAFFGEPYRRIVNAAHASGMDLWLHSCGKITRLMPEFIRVGMDLVNPYQSRVCGLEEMAQFAGKIAFLTTVGSQGSLNDASEEQILAECALLGKWGTEKGGLIVSPTIFNISDETERIVTDYFTRR